MGYDTVSSPNSMAPMLREMDIFHLVGLLWRARWALIGANVVVGLLAAGYFMQFGATWYQAKAAIVLSGAQNDNQRQQAINDNTSLTYVANTQVGILTSRAMFSQLAQATNAHGFEEYAGLNGSEEVISKMAKNIEVRNMRHSFIIEILATSQNPEHAISLTNQLVEIYTNQQRDNYLAASEKRSKQLSKRVLQSKYRLLQSQDNLRKFKEDTHPSLPQELDRLYLQLSQTRQRLDESMQSTALDVAKLKGPPKGAKDDIQKVSGIGAAPKMVTPHIDKDQQRRQHQQQTLLIAKNTLEDKIKRYGADLETLQELNRDMETNAILHENALLQLRQIMDSQELGFNESRVLSLATYAEPSGIGIAVKTIISMFMISMIGIFVLVVRDTYLWRKTHPYNLG